MATTINELRAKRAQAWEAAKNFLESHRTEKGILTAEDDATYTRMEQDIDALGKEIKRLERQQEIENELNRPTSQPITAKPSANVGDIPVGKHGTKSKEYSTAFWNMIRNNHTAIIERAIFDKVQEKIKANYDFNPAAHRMVKPSCFSAKIICGNCSANYVKGMTRTNKHDGLVEHWYCYGKIRRRNCKAKNIRGDRLRRACCEVLGLEAFDEEIFGKTIDRILVTDKLEFHFYDGTVKTAQIHFFNQAEKKYTDPHKKPFGYQWSNEKGYVLVPKEAEAVRLIFRYYMEGWQITGISKELEAEGYGSIRGRVSRKLVAYVLDSDFYLGIRRIKAQFSESGKEEVIENDHEPLISREMFDAVQKRRDSECRRWKGRERNAKRDGDTRQPE